MVPEAGLRALVSLVDDGFDGEAAAGASTSFAGDDFAGDGYDRGIGD